MPLPTRREAAAGGLALAAAFTARASAGTSDLDARVAEVERGLGGRIGAAIVQGPRRLATRGEERFPLCSTFKLLAAGLVLARVDRGEERLDRRLAVAKADILPYSPVTGQAAGGPGLTVAEICRAAVTRSDNTAGNLMLASFGGPAGLTAYLRTLGDPATRLDRTEPGLNSVPPGDPRDTTTPAAMASTVSRLAVGDALSPASRSQLQDWLIATVTGDARIRAAAPAGWRVGDKTGTCGAGVASDVAVLWPDTGEPPISLAVYAAGSGKPIPAVEAAIAAVARIMLAAVRAA